MASIGVEENLLRSFANKMSFTVKLDQERREFLKQLMANLTKMKLREDTDEYTYVGRCSAGDQQDELLLSISKDEKRKLPRQRAVRRKDSTQGKRLSATPSLSEGYDGDDVSYGLNDDASEEEDEDSELANKSDITRMFKMNKAAYNNSNSNINNAQKQDSCSEVLLKGHKGPILCLNHIGTTLFSGSADGGIKIWDTHGEVCLGTVNAHKNWVSCLDVNRENNTVIAGSYDRSISITDIESVRGDCKYRLLCGHTGPVTAVQFHPRGVLSASADSTVCLWDPRARREAATLRGHSSAVLCIDSRGENVVVSGGKDFSVKLWDLRIGRPIFEFPQVHRDWVKSCMILDTGADDGGSTVATATAAVQKPEQELEKVDGITWKVLSCGYDGVMVVWDPQRGEQVRIVEQKDTIAGAVRLGDERIVSATAGGLINMWNKDLSGEPTTVQQGGDGDEGSEEVTAVGRFNNFVVSGSTNSQIKVWNPLAEDPSLMCRQTLQTHSRKTTCFSQYDSYSFASAGWDGTVQLWSFPVEFR